MSDNEKFGNNPFAALADTLTPRDVSPDGDVRVRRHGPPHAPALQKKATSPKGSLPSHPLAPHADDQEESQLFLQAVHRATPQAKDKKPRREEFALAERVDLPSVEKKKKKGPMPAAAAQPAIPAEPAPAPPVEEDAFFRAMREVKPLPGKGREVPPAVEATVNPAQANNVLQDFLDGKLEFALSLTGEYLEGYVVGLDELTMNKLRAGQYSPEAHLDLHGLNAMQAYAALVGFFRSAWYKGLRSVLLVPGRGRNSSEGFGILRDKLQSWLTQEPFKRVVLAFCTARPVDGGPGSVYVLLRKYRKKGKIYWERMPADPDLF